MKVLVLAEYYPRAEDPTLGVWAHRQTLAARDAGAEVRVLVLHRPIPSLAAARSRDLGAVRRALAQPRTVELDGVRVDYLRYLSPPRPWSYSTWGAWAAAPLRRALRQMRTRFRFDLMHAHYAVPTGDAVRRAAPVRPLVVSVHGGDVHGVHAGSPAVISTLAHARLVLANSAGTARRCVQLGTAPAAAHVVRLGTDLPPIVIAPPTRPTLVSVGNLIERKRQTDVIAALPALRNRHPGIRYVVVGDGPERQRLAELARSLGVQDLVELRGRLPPEQAIVVARSASLFVLPSVAEAFGVSYIEAMAGAVPAIGCRGEDGPEEIAAAGAGMTMVAPRDPAALAATIDSLLSDPAKLERLGQLARRTVEQAFTWDRCGRETLAAYREALEPASSESHG